MNVFDLPEVEPGDYGWCIYEPLFVGETWRLVHYDDDDYWCSHDRKDQHECGDVLDWRTGGCFLDSGAIVHGTGQCDGNCETVPYGCLRCLPGGVDFAVRGDRDGCVYCLALMPEVDLCRLKVGYTTNLDSRLKSFRTANPTSVLLGAWDALPSAESQAHRLLDGRIGTSEVFQVSSLDRALESLHRMFGAKP